MNQPPTWNDSLVISYLGLRKAVGIIGIVLPVILALGKTFVDGPGLQSSMSAYYYTSMRNVLVGSLCAIAAFLVSYRGYERQDDIAGDLAAIFALGVALCPTTMPPGPTVVPRPTFIGTLHLIFAAGFFFTIAFFALVLFRKTDPSTPPTPKKLQRNVVYTACGYTILACIALMAVVALLPATSAVKRFSPVFWLESAAVVAFGVAWLTKGEGILKDHET